MLKKLSLIMIFLLCGCAFGNQNLQIDCSKSSIPTEESENSVINQFGEKVLWDQNSFPITVIIDTEMRPSRIDVVLDAIEKWNNAVGAKVFLFEFGFVGEEKKGTIWITEENLRKNTCGDQVYGLARRYYRVDFFRTKKEIIYASIKLHMEVPPQRLLNTVIHELGHALGLHHDKEKDSIMFPHNTGNRLKIMREDILHVKKMIGLL